MVDNVIKNLQAIIPFLAPYPIWVKVLVAIWIVLTAVIVIALLFTPKKEEVALDKSNEEAAADVSLFMEMRSIFDEEKMYEVYKDHDFGAMFPKDDLLSIKDYRVLCRSPRSVYFNRRMEELKCELLSSIDQMLNYVERYTYGCDVPHLIDYRELPKEHEDGDPVRFSTQQKQLNDSADSVYEAYCRFVKEGREELRVT